MGEIYIDIPSMFKSQLETLPKDIIRHILRYLNFEDLNRMKYVNNMFKVLCRFVLTSKINKINIMQDHFCFRCDKENQMYARYGLECIGYLPLYVCEEIFKYLDFADLITMTKINRGSRQICWRLIALRVNAADLQQHYCSQCYLSRTHGCYCK